MAAVAGEATRLSPQTRKRGLTLGLPHNLSKGIPKLLRLAALQVRLPRFEILALERLAESDGQSVDAVLARELLDIISAHSDYLVREICGFKAALRWPQ
ncbi:MAG TPA: hypothetical protein VGQ46_15925 [Thermoanaerobaculia bacterium]|nr:hypothetical protein [Thermoanaerobaculia bacterium]